MPRGRETTTSLAVPQSSSPMKIAIYFSSAELLKRKKMLADSRCVFDWKGGGEESKRDERISVCVYGFPF